MKSRLIPALLLACAPSAPAQTLQPQFYLWANASEAPPGWSEHQVLPMTIVGSAPNWYTDPVDCMR